MVERHGVHIGVDCIVNPILQAEIGAAVSIAFKKTVLDASPEIQQDFGNFVAPLVVGYVVGYSIEHRLRVSFMQC